jgi:acetyl-CoA synthetase
MPIKVMPRHAGLVDDMEWETIRKSEAERATAALADDIEARTCFTWEMARSWLEGLPGGGINIAHEAVDRHVASGHGAEVAVRWLGREGEARNFTYAELAGMAARFANVLAAHGVGRGDRLFALAGRVPELYAAALGSLKAGLAFTPLFAAFGPEPIRARMEIGEAVALVTTETLYRRKVAPWRAELPSLRLVLIIGDTAPEGCVALGPAMAAASDRFETAATGPEDVALIHFTSGTTGRPKGAVHVHGAVVAHAATGRFALDLRPGDRYWCTADPGWVTGTSYGIIAPLVNRVTMIVDEAEFDLERWYGILERERVEVWYTAPTAIRMMMRAGKDAAKGHDFSSLRFLASVGEPLNPEGVVWGQGGLRAAVPRQLVADRDRRHHDRQHRGDGHQAGLDGQAAAGHRGGHRRARGRRGARAQGRRGGRARAQARLAVDDARLPARGGALRQVLRRRLVPLRRSRDARR